MSRLDKIARYGEQVEIDKANSIKQERTRKRELVEQILLLEPRIGELVATANACISNGIQISRENHNSSNDFMAEGIYHRLGFNYAGDTGEITDIRICAGGACGRYGVSTDGVVVYGIDASEHYVHASKAHRYDPPTEYMERFINEFDSFEKRFYDYVDSVVE